MDKEETEKMLKAIDYEERRRCIDKRICYYCKEKMKNPIPTEGEFKGQVQKYTWYCDCKDYPKGMFVSIG